MGTTIGVEMTMRVLFVAAWFPHPPDNGARMRTYYLLRELAARHEVDLLAFHRSDRTSQPRGDELRDVCQVLGVFPFPEFRPTSGRALLGTVSPYPRALSDTHSPQMAAGVRRAMEQRRYDVVVTSEIGSGIFTSRYVIRHGGVPQVIEDLELSMIRSKIDSRHSAWGRLRHRVTWWKLQRYAGFLLARVAGCTVASEVERDVVRGLAPDGLKLAVIPNGVDLGWYAGDFGPPEPDALVFNGALTYEANYEAMRFFLGQVFPRIRAVRPAATLRITGRTAGVELDRLPLTDGVELTGYVEDVRPVVARSAVCVAPLTMGGGTRIKILEAMALGTPVVATSRGAEGLEVKPGEDILIADDPEGFAAQVLRLLSDAALRDRLARNGRRLVASRYDWRRVGERFAAFVEQVARGRD